jgi:hypothetical protein
MSPLASSLRRAGALLLEPAPVTAPARAAPLEVVVTALAAGAGATTVARGVAQALGRTRPVELTGIDPVGAVSPGPGTTVVRDAAPGDVGHLGPRGRGRVLVAVADGRREPALAVLVRGVLARRHEAVLLVANRVRDPEAWHGAGAFCIPESRVGAWLVQRRRRPAGAMREGFDALAAALDLAPPGCAFSGLSHDVHIP